MSYIMSLKKKENHCTRVSCLTELPASGLQPYLEETPAKVFSLEILKSFSKKIRKPLL